MPQASRRRWLARPLPLLLAVAALTAVFALGLFLRQQALLAQQMKRMKRPPEAGEAARLQAASPSQPSAASPPATRAACVPGEERTEDGITYVGICSGTFTMGSAENDSQASADETPAHQVTLSEFWIGKTEITNEQYRRFRPSHQGWASLPVTNVSWFDAKSACEHFGGRLPTEAEWEYAARTGSHATSSNGNSNGALHHVGTKNPNARGLHDMHGNAWEWVADWFGPYRSEAQANPPGPSEGTYRVLRGGTFGFPPRYLRSAFRGGDRPELRYWFIGFRCARDSWP